MAGNWKEAVVSPDTQLAAAIARIDAAGLQVALVLNAAGELAGIVTDGDVRRAILSGRGLDVPVAEAMNRSATAISESADSREMLALMRRKVIHHLPLTGSDGRVVGLVTLDELTGAIPRPNWVVLMAGGLGTRLHPLTNERPKALLPVGGKPILESILESFAEQGFKRIFLSVNYKAEMIRAHFGSGERWGIQIEYLVEERRLGTAGGLRLLPERPSAPVIVMNGDLLTRIRFDSLLKFHEGQRSAATMAVRDYELTVPYGVVQLDQARIAAIEEKPSRTFFVNAGIYILDPEALDELPEGRICDMPELFNRVIAAGKTTAAYPVREYWIDIGRIEELERANREWPADSQ
ncbi:MAG: nucleotidyltransferase family protein [Steroidobacteraceae bacterium]